MIICVCVCWNALFWFDKMFVYVIEYVVIWFYGHLNEKSLVGVGWCVLYMCSFLL